MDLVQRLNKIASDKQTSGITGAAIAALVLIDKNNEVVFDPDDLPGTLTRLFAAPAAPGIGSGSASHMAASVGVPVTQKITFTAEQIAQLSGTSGDLPAIVLPANSVILSTTVKHSEQLGALVGGTEQVSAATAQLVSAQNNYGTALDVAQDPGPDVLDFHATPNSPSGDSLINLRLTVEGTTLDAITDGAIEAWITYFVRPEATPDTVAILYGVCTNVGSDNPANNKIYQIDPTNGQVSAMVQLSCPLFTIGKVKSLALSPGTNVLYGIVHPLGQAGVDYLVRIAPNGVCEAVGQIYGDAADHFASIAFRRDGVLYGVTDESDPNHPESLFSINANGGASFLFTLGHGGTGEAIAGHRNGLLYHSSGSNPAYFESINPDTQQVVPIDPTGQTTEVFAMTCPRGHAASYLSDDSSNLYTLNVATGARTFVGSMATQLPSGTVNKGLALRRIIPAEIVE